MQKGIGLPVFGAKILANCFFALQECVVFRMLCDQLGSNGFHGGECLTPAMLAPGVDKKQTGLISTRVEHDKCG